MAAFSVGAIEAELQLDRTKFQRGLREARAEAQRFEKRPIKAVLELKDAPAKAALKKFYDAARARRPIRAALELNDKAAKASLDAFFVRNRRRTIKVDVDVRRGAIERTTAAVGFLNRALGGITGTVSQAVSGIPIIGQVLSATLGAATSAGQAAEEVVTKLVSSFSGLGSLAAPIGQLSGQIASFVVSLAGIALVAGGVIIALNAILQAAIALGGALIALVASAAAAAAGLGALGIAFAFALGPAVLVAIALFSRFQAVLQARKAREQELAGAVQAQKQAEQQRASALQQTQAAVQNLRTQTVAAYQAMRQSVEDLLHAENARENAALGRQGARLAVRRARQDLKDFLREAGASEGQVSKLFQRFQNVDFTPGAARGLFSQIAGKDIRGDQLLQLQERLFAVKEAVQGVRNADLSYHDSLGQLNKAEQTRAEFVRKGISAYGPYRQALDQLAKARVREAHAAAQSTSAQRKYEQALKKLSPTEQGTLSRIDKLVKGFNRFAKILTEPVFKAFNGVLDQLSGKSGIFEGALKQVGDAFGTVVKSFGSFLGEPRTLDAFKIMSKGAADLIRTIGGKAFPDFLRILREIAITALPEVEKAAKGVANWLHNIAGQPDKIHKATKFVISQFKVWAGLVGSIGSFLLSVLPHAAKAGAQLATWLKRIVDHWTKWINKHPKEVDEFFRKAVKRTEDIAKWLAKAVLYLANNLPKAAKTAIGVFRTMAKIASGIYHTFKVLADLFQGRFKKAAEDAGAAFANFGSIGDPSKRFNPAQGKSKGHSFVERFFSDLLHGASGGIFTRATLGVFGEGSDPEALIPLRPDVLANIGRAIANATVRMPGPAAAAAGGGSLRAGPVHLGDQIFQIHGYVNEDKLLIKARREREREMRKWG